MNPAATDGNEGFRPMDSSRKPGATRSGNVSILTACSTRHLITLAHRSVGAFPVFVMVVHAVVHEALGCVEVHEGIAVNLPEPFGKAAQDSRTLSVTCQRMPADTPL